MTIGVLGGGQLGLMLGEAAKELGHTCRFFDPSESSCAQEVGKLVVSTYDDVMALESFVTSVDVVTFEFENIPLNTVELLAKKTTLLPPPAALGATQDRLTEKDVCNQLGLQTAPYQAVDDASELAAVFDQLGGKGVLKTRRLGYDGKGQVVLHSGSDLAAGRELAATAPCILEGFVQFDRELSIVAVRAQNGDIVTYPLVQNVHREGILRQTTAPAPDVDSSLQQRADDIARALLEHFDYVGTLAIELFDCGGELLINELAPRVHNSGHWSIEGAETSQFSNHIRAITGMPLGATTIKTPSVMLNVIGAWPDLTDYKNMPGIAVHDYGKSERPGRKIGHITLTGAGLQSIDTLAALLA